MGQVFTWDAIQAGRIPKLDDFHRVAREMRTILFNEPSVVSALLFGSVIRGDFNVRSDIDCAVIFEEQKEDQAMRAMNAISRAAHTLHVPVTFTPCDTVVAKTPYHHLHATFTQHLMASVKAGGLIKGNFVDLLAPTTPAELEIETYIKMKMYTLLESLACFPSFGEERLAAFFKKALEAPMHVARKLLIYRGLLGGDDSKKEVQARYSEYMPQVLSKQFNYLIGLDRAYSTDLGLQLERPKEEKYKGTVRMIQERVPRVIKFIRSNIRYLDGSL